MTLTDESPSPPSPVHISRPVMQITLLTALAYGIQFAIQILAAYYFGANAERDIYVGVLAVTSYIAAIFISSIPATWLPLLVEARNCHPERLAVFSSTVVNFSFLLLSGVSIIIAFFASGVIQLFMPGFTDSSLVFATQTLQILLPTTIINVLVSLITQIYYTNNDFIIPAIAMVLNYVVNLITLAVFTPSCGAWALSISYLAGSLAGLILLMPKLFGKYDYRFVMRLIEPEIYQLGKVALPLLFSACIFQLTNVIQRGIASTLPTGSVSYLGYATQIITVMSALTSGAIATIVYPKLSEAWSNKNIPYFREILSSSIVLVLAISLPVAGFLVVLGVPIIAILFERGAFLHKDVLAVSGVLQILMGSFLANSLGNIIAKGYYISRKTLWAAIQEIFALFVLIILSNWMAHSYGYIGLAYAATLSSILSVLLSVVGVLIIFKGIRGRYILFNSLKIVLGSGVSATILYVIYTLLMQSTKNFLISSIIGLAFATMIYLYFYVAILRVKWLH